MRARLPKRCSWLRLAVVHLRDEPLQHVATRDVVKHDVAGHCPPQRGRDPLRAGASRGK